MRFSRRAFLVGVPAAGTALALGLLGERRGPQSPGGSEAEADSPLANALGESQTHSRAPVVSFHLDRPYLDLTGLEQPYVPPSGMRSGAPLAALSDEELSRFYGFI